MKNLYGIVELLMISENNFFLIYLLLTSFDSFQQFSIFSHMFLQYPTFSDGPEMSENVGGGLVWGGPRNEIFKK